jgi:hypothetical protein
MSRVKYEILPPVGPDSFFTEGSVSDLLFDIPYFFLAKIVPPMEVVNEVLQRGITDAGMSGGCKWKPFQLDPESYANLVDELKLMGFLVIQSPEWVKTRFDWQMWCLDLVWGIPALVHRQQMAELRELEAQREAATEAGDEQLAVGLLTKIQELCTINMQFVKKNRLSQPRLPVFRRPPTNRN